MLRANVHGLSMGEIVKYGELRVEPDNTLASDPPELWTQMPNPIIVLEGDADVEIAPTPDARRYLFALERGCISINCQVGPVWDDERPEDDEDKALDAKMDALEKEIAEASKEEEQKAAEPSALDRLAVYLAAAHEAKDDPRVAALEAQVRALREAAARPKRRRILRGAHGPIIGTEEEPA